MLPRSRARGPTWTPGWRRSRARCAASTGPDLSDLRVPGSGCCRSSGSASLLSVFQQFVGINVIFYYSASLWQSVGINQSDSLLISFSTSIVNIVGTLIAMALVDRIGRRPLLLIGSAGMAVALGRGRVGVLAGVPSGNAVRLPKAQGTVALIAAHVFVLFFALSWGVVVWVLLGEMFPNRIRAPRCRSPPPPSGWPTG